MLSSMLKPTDARFNARLDGVMKESYETHIQWYETFTNKLKDKMAEIMAEEMETVRMANFSLCVFNQEIGYLEEEIKELKRPKLKRNNSI